MNDSVAKENESQFPGVGEWQWLNFYGTWEWWWDRDVTFGQMWSAAND